MAKIEITKTELVWPGKYNEDGTRKEVERVNLPFQVIETVNETRATREAAKKPKQPSLFDVWQAKEGDSFEEGWKNKLIWGENKLVMSSLLEKFGGKIDLIYIDPPFATGADFRFIAQIGERDLELTKEQSIIEEKVYRDTWGSGLASYVSMLYARLILIRDLLSNRGIVVVHLDDHVAHYIKTVMDENFGYDFFQNQIIWRRGAGHSDAKRFGRNHDLLLVYSKGNEFLFVPQYPDESPEEQERLERAYPLLDKQGRRYCEDNLAAAGPGSAKKFGDRIIAPPRGQHWRFSQENIDELWNAGRIVFNREGTPRVIKYADETSRMPIQDIWTDCIRHISTVTGFPTEKPERLLTRILNAFSSPEALVADIFCGSGTTLAVAEKLGRRWIGCDLSKWAIHVTRKRLLDIENCKPFEVLNLGKYERKYWQGITFLDRKKPDQQLAIYQYLTFILKLYGAEPLVGMQHLHGKKSKAVVHVGAVDAPVTIDEINSCLDECVAIQQKELHILGWEWEMGLYDLMTDAAKGRGVKLVLLNIPREVMEQQAVEKGDIQFFELAFLEVDIKQEKGRKIVVSLKDFVIPNTELVPEEIRSKIKKWSDYIDYWAIDWDFQNDTFMNGWVTYRTRKDRTLALKSDAHSYEKPGKYTVMVKVVDIFGNDTSQAFEVEVK